MVAPETNGSTSVTSKTVQLIDEECNFNDEVGGYIKDSKLEGFGYHLVAVFGSQSTGKSTLLNRLFGTRFDIMDEAQRKQTTKGIWLSKALDSDILIMDVEGTDSRERGDEQDFERRSALFSLAISEVIIVNLWEHQVGLYQGANMGLLKTVFEVNLQLFQQQRGTKERALLMFVLRDHIGTTPLSNLSETLKKDLANIWASLSKPPGLENCTIEDYFDFQFTALPHKILMPEKFDEGVVNLRKRFMEKEDPEYVFHPTYHKRIPADGIPLYAKQCWDQIVANKDLDLPTQQVLLAQYRCDEIAALAMESFDATIKPLENMVRTDSIIADLGPKMSTSRKDVLGEFEDQAQRYHKETFKRKYEELRGTVDLRLHVLFRGQISGLHSLCIKRFQAEVETSLKKEGYNFAKVVLNAKEKVMEKFDKEAQAVMIEGTDWTYDHDRELLVNDIDEQASRLRKDEISRVLDRLEKQVKTELEEPVALAFAKPSNTIWDTLIAEFEKIKQTKVESFKEKAVMGLNATEEDVSEGVEGLKSRAWTALRDRLDGECEPTHLLLRLREYFEDRFRYDEQGVPRIWKPTDDIDALFKSAREQTLQLIPILSTITLSNGTSPALDIPSPPDYTPKSFFVLLSPTKQADLTTRFKRAADTLYLEAKNSTISSISNIPAWFYVLLLILGWNELMAVIRNPILFVLFALMAGGGYLVVQAGLLGPLMKVGNAVVDQSVEIARDTLRNFVHPPERRAMNAPVSNVSRTFSEADTVIMDDLDADGRRKGWRNDISE